MFRPHIKRLLALIATGATIFTIAACKVEPGCSEQPVIRSCWLNNGPALSDEQGVSVGLPNQQRQETSSGQAGNAMDSGVSGLAVILSISGDVSGWDRGHNGLRAQGW